MPSGSAADIWAVVGTVRTSGVYRVRQVVHWTCSATFFNGITGRKNRVKKYRPLRLRYFRSPPQRGQWKTPPPTVR
jgi:hypothetical protein